MSIEVDFDKLLVEKVVFEDYTEMEPLEDYLFCLDWDGTLVNSYDIIYSSVSKLYKKFKFSHHFLHSKLTKEDKEEIRHVSIEDFLFSKYRYNIKTIIDEYWKIYEEEVKNIRLFDHVEYFLERAVSDNDHIAMVISNKPSSIVKKEMKQLGIYDYFVYAGEEMIITPEETNSIVKPDYRVFNYVQKKLKKVVNKRCLERLLNHIILVGDSEIDLEFSKHIGADFYFNRSTIEDSEFDKIYGRGGYGFNSFLELYDEVEKNNQ